MAGVIHIAEIAAILAVAYTLGWAIGYVARRATAPRSVPAAIPEARLAAVTAPADALVKAPVIAPLASSLTPAPAEAAPVPQEPSAPIETPPPPVEIAPLPETPPAAVADQPSPEPVAADAPAVAPTEAAVAPVEAAPVEAAAEPVQAPIDSQPSSPAARSLRRFRPTPKPAEAAPISEPAPFSATPASHPGEAWSGEIRGKTSVKAIVAQLPPEPVAEQPAPEPVPPSPAIEPDEDAAMRAIEGGWSRIGARALSDAPELSDMGAAVAAATSAVEQVLAKAGIESDAHEATRPRGLTRPRHGMKDDLKRINGLGALDESTLNNLGVYHFDQIAGWNDAQVSWMEGHAFARGRIGREEWQRQARELSAASAA